MSDEARRYLTVIQDPRGYPTKLGTEPAPPEGPSEPVLLSVVKADDYEAIQADRDALAARVKELEARIAGALEALETVPPWTTCTCASCEARRILRGEEQ